MQMPLSSGMSMLVGKALSREEGWRRCLPEGPVAHLALTAHRACAALRVRIRVLVIWDSGIDRRTTNSERNPGNCSGSVHDNGSSRRYVPVHQVVATIAFFDHRTVSIEGTSAQAVPRDWARQTLKVQYDHSRTGQ